MLLEHNPRVSMRPRERASSRGGRESRRRYTSGSEICSQVQLALSCEKHWARLSRTKHCSREFSNLDTSSEEHHIQCFIRSRRRSFHERDLQRCHTWCRCAVERGLCRRASTRAIRDWRSISRRICWCCWWVGHGWGPQRLFVPPWTRSVNFA